SPNLPSVAAGPAGHDEDSETVGFFVELFAVEAAFEAHRVQTHIANIFQIGLDAAGGPAKEEVGSPGGAANQHVLAIDLEEKMPLRGEFGSNAADAKIGGSGVTDSVSHGKAELGVVQVRVAHGIRPPEDGIHELELGKLFRSEFQGFGLAWRESHLLA